MNEVEKEDIATVYCGKCGLSFHEHEYDDYPKEEGRRIYFCKCPNCKETIHKDNEMVVECCGKKFCWVCINDDHVKNKHPERSLNS